MHRRYDLTGNLRSSIPEAFSGETQLIINHKDDAFSVWDVTSQGATAEARMAGGVDQAHSWAVRLGLFFVLIEH